ncbi:hypothetical protein [Streptomyces sp. NRRL F-5630]|uniref:hypothetical protein n=1 Tax=Streptomyces sp. NRRL F-5630 TaxID=1463864 RepID=UPI003D7431DB
MTPAETLASAADKLRTACAQARTWQLAHAVGAAAYPKSRYIAAMHPGVGTALAAWLESWTGIDLREDAALPEDARHALAVARQILGGTP